MSEDRTPVDRAVELLVYAPVGMAVEARTLLPRLIERGRERVDGQVTMARMVGQFAVRQGRSQATSRISTAGDNARDTLGDLGLVPSARAGSGRHTASRAGRVGAEPIDEGGPGTTSSTATVSSAPGPASTAPTGGPADLPDAEGVDADVPDADVPDAEGVGIPDYDSLAASQVIPRLAGLSADELETVRAYETAKRGRKTILNKINQLQR